MVPVTAWPAAVMVRLNDPVVTTNGVGVPESVTVKVTVYVPAQAALGARPEVVLSVPEELNVRQGGKPVAIHV